jgi:hypothetical protein
VENVHLEPMDITFYEAAPSGSQVMDVIGWLVSVLDHNKVARHLVEGTGCSLMDFCSHHLESFDGKGNHISTKN